MKWPWRRKEAPVVVSTPVPADEAVTDDLARARAAHRAALAAQAAAARRAPAVAAAGHAIQRELSRNGFAELVRNALGSGS